MTIADKSILNKIKKLMNLTVERGATPEEAANAAAKVQQILFEHNLSMSQVEAHQPEEKKEHIGETVVDFTASNKISYKWRRRLHSDIGDHYFCDSIWFSKTHNRVIFIGKPSNIEICVYMAAMIGEQIHKMGLVRYNDIRKQGWGNALSGYQAYCFGVVQTVRERLAAQLRTQEQQCNALMVVNTQQIQAYKDEHHPDLKPARKSKGLSDALSFHMGLRDGRKVSLVTGIGSSAADTKKVR